MMKTSVITALSLCLLLGGAAHAQLPAPTTIHNDDTCDIGQFPAATLLVPYFEVDINPARQVDTLVSLVNTGQRPQIVSATVWTNWGFPVFTFDTFLGSYDVHSYSLYDMFGSGTLPPSSVNGPRGPRSVNANPNFAPDALETCRELSVPLDPAALAFVRSTLTTGLRPGNPVPVGGMHAYAKGYITFDVVSRCGNRLPTDPGYFSEILYDNVLTGDVILTQAEPRQYVASPMVHIRAMPEGGAAGQGQPVSFPFTFYDLYTPGNARKLDRRQPLPSLFASRFVQGGSNSFNTEYIVWREPVTTLPLRSRDNAAMPFREVVRFDESENPTVFVRECQICTCFEIDPSLSASSRVSVDDAGVIPPDFAGTAQLGGWVYFNLSNGGSPHYSATRQDGSLREGVSQNWIQTIITSGSHAISLTATQLGNGCTPDPGITSRTRTGHPALGPAPDINP